MNIFDGGRISASRKRRLYSAAVVKLWLNITSLEGSRKFCWLSIRKKSSRICKVVGMEDDTTRIVEMEKKILFDSGKVRCDKKKKTTILEIVSLLDKTIFVFAQNRNLIERKYIYFLEEYKRYRYIY